MIEKNNKDWKERFEKEVEEDKSMGGTLYLHKWIPNFIDQIISERDKEFIELLEDKIIPLYQKEEWFEKAWEEYRQHVLNSNVDDMKMPGFVFKKYVEKYAK